MEVTHPAADRIHPGFKVDIIHSGQSTKYYLTGPQLLPIVFVNLFRNSAEHGGDVVHVTVTVSRVAEGIQIDIVDDGRGIASDIRKGIFQKGVSTSDGGYGLYLAKKVIEGYKGSIKLMEDDTFRGAAFRIVLPK